MEKTRLMPFLSLLAIGLLAVSTVKARTITVSGVVTDSVTGAPVPGAIVLLYYLNSLNVNPNDIGNLKLDTSTTGADGSYLHSMTIPDGSLINLIAYSVLKDDYRIDFGLNRIVSIPRPPASSVTLNVKLSRGGEVVRDTLTIRGLVVDSATQQGIGGALVIVSGLADYDTAGNTVLTNADGTYSKQVIVGNSGTVKALVYMISKDGYKPSAAQRTITGADMDMGTILLRKGDTGVKWPVRFTARPGVAGRATVYSPDGRVVHAGSPAPVGRSAGRSGRVLIGTSGRENGDAGRASVYVNIGLE